MLLFLFSSSFNSTASVSSKLNSHLSSLFGGLDNSLFTSSFFFVSFCVPLNQKHYFQFLVCISKNNKTNYNKDSNKKQNRIENTSLSKTSFSRQIFVLDVPKIFITSLVKNRDQKIVPSKIAFPKIVPPPQQVPSLVRVWVRVRVGGNILGGEQFSVYRLELLIIFCYSSCY